MSMRRLPRAGKIAAAVMFSVLMTFVMCMPDTANASSYRYRIRKLRWVKNYSVFVLPKGETYTFKVRYTPSKGIKKKVKFTSSRKSVAVINQKGKVTAKKNGKAIITAKSLDGSKKKIKCTLYVGQRITSLTWKNSGSERTIKRGEKFNFDSKVLPYAAKYKKVTYSSSSPKTVSVSSKGVVIGKKKGKAIISAKSQDGSGKYALCRVTVGTKVSKVKWKNTGLTTDMKIGDVFDLKAECLSKKASNKKLSYSSSAPSVAKVSRNGRITAKKSGRAVIKATAEDGTGKKVKTVVTVTNPLSPQQSKFIAHRGLQKSYPENTVQAFKGAAGYPFWGIECDVWETEENDGTLDLMIMHDSNIKKMTGFDRSIKDVNMKNRDDFPITGGNKNDPSVRYLIPDLSEYIDAVDPSVSGKELVIELKDKSISKEGARRILDVLREKEVHSSQVTFLSFYRQSLLNLKKAADVNEEENENQEERIDDQIETQKDEVDEKPDEVNKEMYDASGAEYMLLMKSSTSESEAADDIGWAVKNGMNGVSVSQKIADRIFVNEVRAKELECAVWTVDDVVKAKNFIEMGVDSVTTNYALWKK